MMIFVSVLQKQKQVSLESASKFIQLLAPFAPHIAEELWERLGGTTSIIEAGWPQFDAKKLVRSQTKIVIQVNGKLRDEIEMEADASQEAILKAAAQAPKVIPYLEQGQVVKSIYVPQKLVNFVVRPK